jgi:hypothetical protein
MSLSNTVISSNWLSVESDDRVDSDITALLEYINEWLDLGQTRDIDLLTSEISSNLYGWVKAGFLVHKIKVEKIYKFLTNRIGTFKAFCENVLKRSSWSINRLIEGSLVVTMLAQSGFTVLPNCESQARPLVKFIKSGNLVEKWKEVIDSVPAHLITTSRIIEIVEPDRPEKISLKLSPDTYRKLSQKALDLGLTPDEYLRELLSDETQVEINNSSEDTETKYTDIDRPCKKGTTVEPVSQKKIDRWLIDLEALVNGEPAVVGVGYDYYLDRAGNTS